MNKTQVIERIAKETNESIATTRNVLDALDRVIMETLLVGEAVKLKDFGTFTVVEKLDYVGHNPQTGKPMEIPVKKKVRFRPAKSLAAVIE